MTQLSKELEAGLDNLKDKCSARKLGHFADFLSKPEVKNLFKQHPPLTAQLFEFVINDVTIDQAGERLDLLCQNAATVTSEDYKPLLENAFKVGPNDPHHAALGLMGKLMDENVSRAVFGKRFKLGDAIKLALHPNGGPQFTESTVNQFMGDEFNEPNDEAFTTAKVKLGLEEAPKKPSPRLDPSSPLNTGGSGQNNDADDQAKPGCIDKIKAKCTIL